MTDQSRSSDNDNGGLTRQQFIGRAATTGVALTGVGGLLAACGGGDSKSKTAAAAGGGSKGGTLRVGVSGGSSKSVIEAQGSLTKAETARIVATFEGVSHFDENLKPTPGLAEEITLENPKQWLIRLRDGVEFHNGKTLTSDDLVYSLQRTLDKKLGLAGLALLGAIDVKRMQKLDKRTVRLHLSRPDVTLNDSLSQYFQSVVPDGYSPHGRGQGPLRWIGTGAYKVESFTPGRQSVHVPFENYWGGQKPNFDKVIILDFPDDSARINALLGGQVDAAIDVPLAQVPIVEKHKDLKLYDVHTGAWNPFGMRVDIAPFKDVRVRQALRLLANREQIVAQALAGHARVANDLHSPFDPAYIGDQLPQRRYDPEKAKSLLKAAGQSDLRVELVTSPGVDAGAVEAAEAFAQSAKAGGVTVKVRNVDSGTIYGDQYLKWPFAMDLWSTRNYLPQVAYDSLPTSPDNATHWDNPRYTKLYEQALATADESKRGELLAEMQRMEYDEGGQIIPVFKNFIDAYSSKLEGLKPDGGAVNFNKYGNGFKTIHFAS
jgi:peptide/nickel transport system substrate-binding protein